MHLIRLLNRSLLRPGIAPQLRRIPARTMLAAMKEPKTLKVLQYEFVEGMLEKRAPYRDEHLKQAADKVAEGKLVLAGALGEGALSGLMIFKDVTTEEIEAYAKADPYYQNGLVTKWTVSPYAVVYGTLKDAL